MSAFEQGLGFTRPVDNFSVINGIPDDIIKAQAEMQACQKLYAVLCSKSTREINVYVGDEVEVYLRSDREKEENGLQARLCYQSTVQLKQLLFLEVQGQ